MVLEKAYTKKIGVKHRKKYAQFFTPETIAQIMVKWILGNENLKTVLEPAFGLGVFSRLLLAQKSDLKIKGFDVDSVIFDYANHAFSDKRNVQLILEDYLFNDWKNSYDGIICNPPYFKFHDYENKKALKEIRSKLNVSLNGFTNIYTLFLLKSIYQLNKNGRAAYIIPSEFLNADYGKLVKQYLIQSKALKHLIIFDFKENIFDNALTTSAILLIEKAENKAVNFIKIENKKQFLFLNKDLNNIDNQVVINYKNLKAEIKWRKYYEESASEKYKYLVPFNSVAKVVRGIATGANDYFMFNKEKVKKYQISTENLLPCIAKSKDVQEAFFTDKHFENLKNKNANIYLLNAENSTSESVSTYLKLGEKLEIDKRFLTSRRKPWYKLENRPPAPIWVSVFNRNKIKFIRNEAKIYNLTTFHCIYPKNNLFNHINIDLLFAYLQTDIAKDIFNDNRREYGDGLKKFEPNDLNNAMMLDLSKLSVEDEKFIVERFAIFKKDLDNKHLQKIEQYLKKIFSA